MFPDMRWLMAITYKFTRFPTLSHTLPANPLEQQIDFCEAHLLLITVNSIPVLHKNAAIFKLQGDKPSTSNTLINTPLK